MAGSRQPIISLLTDFGDHDEYVGVLKAAILCRAPQATIVDLCHQIKPHDIRQAASMIAAAFEYFPEDTLHVMVVDPGVGGKRDIVYAQAHTCGFLCPDNGLLSELLAREAILRAWRVINTSLYSDVVSATFHGRDIIAPVAGFLSSGGPPEQLGPRKAVHEILSLGDPLAYVDHEGCLVGTVVAIDRFGNMITDIGRGLLTSAWEGDLNQILVVEGEKRHAMPLVGSYSARPAGELLATVGSRNTLEIAVNQGSAGRQLGIAVGATIRVSRKDPFA
jgi:S-adenosylmethionine hydrolase